MARKKTVKPPPEIDVCIAVECRHCRTVMQAHFMAKALDSSDDAAPGTDILKSIVRQFRITHQGGRPTHVYFLVPHSETGEPVGIKSSYKKVVKGILEFEGFDTVGETVRQLLDEAGYPVEVVGG